VRSVHTKDGRDIDCRDIIVFDQTNTGLPVSLWNIETVHRAESWRPRETGSFIPSGLHDVHVKIIKRCFATAKVKYPLIHYAVGP
jgi:hypothetical protein